MLLFILKRLVLFIPTLLVISVIIFGLSKLSADDPVANKLITDSDQASSSEIHDNDYIQTAHELGLDKPIFYFTISSQAFPHDLYKIVQKSQRNALENLIKQHGNWAEIANYHQSIKSLLSKIPPTDSLGLKNDLQQLLLQSDDEKIIFLLNEIQVKTHKSVSFTNNFNEIQAFYAKVKNQETRYKLFIPIIHKYGSDNQYHLWLSAFLKGSLGLANNGQTVWQKISLPLSITLYMSIPTLIFAYLIGIPIGIFTAANKGKRISNFLIFNIFAWYSIPTFWIALMAIRFLTTPEFGLKIFPSAGLNNLNDQFSTFYYLFSNTKRFILPVLCMVVHPIAYIARLTEGAVVENLLLDYVRTARAKGLSWRKIINNHILKNAIFPLITLLGQFLPVLITGSFIIEYVFNIKGMGRVAYEANNEHDWQVVYTVLMFSALMVLIGNLIADILYKWANPRVKFS